jgi:phosphoenolpyruvate synthase/pyruvate phosphate dikinase
MTAAAFRPRDVIVRLWDFKTNEDANLVAGTQVEPRDGSPVIGFPRRPCRNFLVRAGIDSLSLNRDSLLETTLEIVSVEESLASSSHTGTEP